MCVHMYTCVQPVMDVTLGHSFSKDSMKQTCNRRVQLGAEEQEWKMWLLMMLKKEARSGQIRPCCRGQIAAVACSCGEAGHVLYLQVFGGSHEDEPISCSAVQLLSPVLGDFSLLPIVSWVTI